jgi:hypothetical protein
MDQHEPQYFVHSYTVQCVLRQTHSLYKNALSTEYDLLLSPSISSTLSFSSGHKVTAYDFFLVLSSFPFFILSFY